MIIKRNGNHIPVICLTMLIIIIELHALEKMLYETDVLDNDIVEVDCIGRER